MNPPKTKLRGMEHLNHLKEELHGKTIEEIEKYFKKEYGCKVRKELPLFCPMYDMLKTDFKKKGALATRGTVFALNEEGIFDGHVACVPFFKFFNEGEPLAHVAPDEDIVSIQRKYDGSLIKVFPFKGKWHIATNGTPVANENFIVLFEKALGLTREEFGKIFDHDKVYMFELCTPENKIVIAYDDYYAKLLLTRCNKTWEELDNGEDVAGHYEVVREAEFEESSVGEEGVVVVYRGGHRVKKKTAWYKTLHKGFGGGGFDGSKLEMVERAIHGGFYDDVLVLCSEEGKRHAEKYKQALKDYVEMLDEKVKTIPGVTGLDGDALPPKDILVERLKDGTMSSLFPHEPEMKRVLNVLFGKYKSVFHRLECGGQSSKTFRDYIKQTMKI